MKQWKNILILSCLSGGLLFLLFFVLVLPASSASWEPRGVVKTYLTTHYPWAEIEILDLHVEEPLPKDPPKSLRMISGPLGRAIFSFEFKSGEKLLVQAKIMALDWVVTSRRPLNHGQIIEKDDVYLALLDVNRMPKDVLTRLEGAWGKTIKRSIGTNRPLIESALGDVPLIKKGQRITLIASAPGLRITSPGEAREDGFPGRQIRVINLSSKQDIRGIPIDGKNVKVIF